MLNSVQKATIMPSRTVWFCTYTSAKMDIAGNRDASTVLTDEIDPSIMGSEYFFSGVANGVGERNESRSSTSFMNRSVMWSWIQDTTGADIHPGKRLFS